MAIPFKKLGIYLELIYTFPAAILAPSLLGWYLDSKAGSGPLFLLLGFFLGLIGGFWYLFKTLKSVKGG